MLRSCPRGNCPADDVTGGPSLREAFGAWTRVALQSFGGPAGQIAIMHRIIVEEKQWVDEQRFLHALNYCMLLPGPEAQQLATYLGWILHRTIGGLMAGILFVLPGFAAILLLSLLYAGYYESFIVQAVFFGIKPAVVAIVVQAVLRIGGRALRNSALITTAALAFVAIFFFGVPFPLILLAAALTGYVGGRLWPGVFQAALHVPALPAGAAAATPAPVITSLAPTWTRTAVTAGVLLLIWWLPVLFIMGMTGTASVWSRIGLFFSQTAVVTFGGAYAVLAYVAQQAVETYGWLQPGEMLDGLGMAETTPGPLIQVVQFVGFMGAYRQPGSLDPMVAGVLGSILTTWVTFVPCFLFIFAGAPWIEHLRSRRGLTSALSGITAAVVGVILNLAAWFSIHVLFRTVHEVRIGPLRLLLPEWATLDPAALAITVFAFAALFWWRWAIMTTLAAAAALGVGWFLVA
jgi:chromate transporter